MQVKCRHIILHLYCGVCFFTLFASINAVAQDTSKLIPSSPVISPLADSKHQTPPKTSGKQSSPKKEIQLKSNTHNSSISKRIDYAIELKQPNQQWRLIAHNHLKKLSPLAVLAAINPGQMLGMVLCEPVKHMTLEEYAQALIDHSSLENITLEESVYVDAQGYRMLKLTYTGTNTQGRFRYLNYIFLRDHYGFQVSAGGKSSDVQASDLEVFMQSIKLLPQKVQGRSFVDDKVRSQKTHSVLVKDHTLSSIHTGLQVVIPKGYQVLLGAELNQLNTDADFAFTSWDPSLHVMFAQRPCPVKDETQCKEILRTQFAQKEKVKTLGDGIQLSFLQKEIVLTKYTSDTSTFTYLYYTHIHNQKALQILAWTTRGQELDAWPTLATLLSRFKAMDEIKKSQLKVQLNDTDHDVQSVQPTYVARDESWMFDVYRHHTLRISWHTPKGMWKVSYPTRDLNHTHPQAHKLNINAPTYGMYSQLSVQPLRGVSVTQSHLDTWKALLTKLSLTNKTTQVKQGTFYDATHKHQSIYQSIELDDEYPVTYRLDTVRVGSAIVNILTWGDALNFEVAVIAQLLGGLKSESHYNITQQDQKWSDYRFRFQLRNVPPEGAWQFQPYAGVGKASSVVTYQTDSYLWGVMTLGESYYDHISQVAQNIVNHWVPGQQHNKAEQLADIMWQNRVVKVFKTSRRSEKTAPTHFYLYLIERAPLLYGYFVYVDEQKLEQKESHSPEDFLQNFKLLTP